MPIFKFLSFFLQVDFHTYYTIASVAFRGYRRIFNRIENAEKNHKYIHRRIRMNLGRLFVRTRYHIVFLLTMANDNSSTRLHKHTKTSTFCDT